MKTLTAERPDAAAPRRAAGRRHERLFYTGIPVAFLLIVPCLLFDLFSRGRFHRATVLGGLLLVVSHPLRLVVGNTRGWLTFAEWLTQWS